MKPERLAHLRTLCSAATPGPWKTSSPFEYDYSVLGVHASSGQETYVISPGIEGDGGVGCTEDATFIAEARTALPEALDYIEELEREQKHLWSIIETYKLAAAVGRKP